MTTTGQGAGLYAAQFAAAEQHLPGHNIAWLAEIRRAALARFEFTGFPTKRDENWKYTSTNTTKKRG